MCIISCILGHLSWNDGSCLVNFNLDVDLRCNLNSILKALLHWHVDCWCGRAFCSYVYGRICEGRFCGLIHCCRDVPVPLRSRALRNSGRVPLSLQENALEGRRHNSPAAQTSAPCPPTHSPASQEETNSLHPDGPLPEGYRRWVLEGAGDLFVVFF